MILQRNGASFSADGKEFKIGGAVYANDKSEYMGLYGIVTEIRTDDDRETENDTPDICCEFFLPDSAAIRAELERRFSDLYGQPKTMEDISLDCVIMAPEMLEPISLSSESSLAAVRASSEIMNLFARVLQMPEEALRSFQRFPVYPPEDGKPWEVVTHVCSLGGCDMGICSFSTERDARIFAALLEGAGFSFHHDTACPTCYAEYMKDRL